MATALTFRPGADTADDLERMARSVLPPDVYDFVACGAGDERTVSANRAGYGRSRLLPRVLKDVSRIDASTSVLGTPLDAPILVSPMGGLSLLHPDGDLAIARAAASAGVGTIVTAASGATLEDVAAASGPARWFGLYWHADPGVTADLVERACSAGYRAIVLTVDAPIRGTRRRIARSGFSMPASALLANLERYGDRATGSDERGASVVATGGRTLTWRGVEWLRSRTRLPLVLKGIMAPADATRAIGCGADALIVSNHGGRQLDSVPGTIEVLEAIVHEVAGRAPVLVDGGVRRATDVVIALALGAAAVGIGRPVAWALACGGQAAVSAFLSDLVSELRRTFTLLGIRTVAEVDRGTVSKMGQFFPDEALAPLP